MEREISNIAVASSRTSLKKKKKYSGAHSRVVTLIQPSFQKKRKKVYEMNLSLVCSQKTLGLGACQYRVDPNQICVTKRL